MAITGRAICPGGGGTAKKLEFTYTGDYTERADGVVELHSSGTLVFLSKAVIDMFLVGGGGAGGTQYTKYSAGCGGGGGGYTKTVKSQSVFGSYEIIIGAGGSVKNSSNKSGDGGVTSFGALASAKGGNGGGNSYYTAQGTSGGDGGSGGGAGGHGLAGAGGSDGNNGGDSDSEIWSGGASQGATTREFGETTGKLYSGGGGGGAYVYTSPAGGAGGGGNGAYITGMPLVKAEAGTANTGGGGGGGFGSSTGYAANGGSGIVSIRVAA